MRTRIIIWSIFENQCGTRIFELLVVFQSEYNALLCKLFDTINFYKCLIPPTHEFYNVLLF